MNDEEIIQRALCVLEERARYGDPYSDSKTAGQFLRLKLADNDREVFAVMFLDTRHRLIAYDELFQGCVDRAQAYPHTVVRQALLHNASAVILAHNHPSDEAKPSEADKALTRQLSSALALVDIKVLDHFVVTRTESVSMADKGLLH